MTRINPSLLICNQNDNQATVDGNITVRMGGPAGRKHDADTPPVRIYNKS